MGTSEPKSGPRSAVRWSALILGVFVVVAIAFVIVRDDSTVPDSLVGKVTLSDTAAPAATPLPVATPLSTTPVPILPESVVQPVQSSASDSQHHPQDRQAQPGMRTLEVSVVDANGNPVADASVEAFVSTAPDYQTVLAELKRKNERPSPQDLNRLQDARAGNSTEDPTWGEPIGKWTSQPDGSVTAELPTDKCFLVATHPDRGSSGIVTVDAGESDAHSTWLRMQLSPRGTLNGRVLDASGLPALGARVVFVKASLPNDEHGRPRIPRPIDVDGDGRFSVEVDAPFFAKAYAELGDRQTLSEYAHGQPGKTRELELRFPGRFAVSGVVVGPDGQPVPKAKVDVAGYEVQVAPATSDETGRFRLDLAKPGHLVLLAKAEGFVTASPIAATLSELQPTAEVVLSLIVPSVISGRVQWSDGAPIGQAMISARPTMPDFGDTAGIAAYTRWESMSQDERTFMFDLDSMAFSNPDGTFRLAAIHPAYSVDVSCFASGDAPGQAEAKSVEPGEDNVILVFERKVAGDDRLTGRVIDGETRAPVARCEILASEWSHWRPRRFGEEHVTVDDPTGRFDVGGLDPGKEYGLVVQAVGYPPTTYGPYKPSADTNIEILLGRHATLRIVVTNERDEPQPGASVQLMSGLDRGFGAIFSSVKTRVVDERGQLDWPELKPGEYAVEAVAQGARAPRQRVVMEAGRLTLVQLVVRQPEGRGRLEVQTLRADGSTWAGADVKVVLYVSDEAATPGLEPVYLGTTDAEGRFVLEHLEPGSYIVDVNGDDTIIPLQPVEVAADAIAHVTMKGGK